MEATTTSSLIPSSEFNQNTVVAANSVRYTIIVDSFSSISQLVVKSQSKTFESNVFSAFNFQWKLVLHPNGDVSKNVNDHVSIYLAVADQDKLAPGWKISAILKFFVYDFKHDKYLVVRDGTVRHYYGSNTEYGISKLLPLSSLNDEANGYIANDCCFFGVDFHAIEHRGMGQIVSLKSNRPESDHSCAGTYRWSRERFSTFKSLALHCAPQCTFQHCDWNWKWKLYFDMRVEGNFSLYLCLQDLPNRQKCVYVEFLLSVIDQIWGKHRVREGAHLFTESSILGGFASFMPIDALFKHSNGFLWNDTLIVEAKITRTKFIFVDALS